MWEQTGAEEEEDDQDEGKCPVSGTFSPNPCEYVALVRENRTTKFRDKICTFYFTGALGLIIVILNLSELISLPSLAYSLFKTLPLAY